MLLVDGGDIMTKVGTIHERYERGFLLPQKCAGCPAMGPDLLLTRVGKELLCTPCYRRVANRAMRQRQRERSR